MFIYVMVLVGIREDQLQQTECPLSCNSCGPIVLPYHEESNTYERHDNQQPLASEVLTIMVLQQVLYFKNLL